METKTLQKTMLFKGMNEQEISSAFTALHAEEKRYARGRIILNAGSTTQKAGLVLDGSVTITDIRDLDW